MIAVTTDWFVLEKTVPEDVRRRVLEAANFRCRGCGSEMGRSIFRRYTQWWNPSAWVEVSGESSMSVPSWDRYVLVVRLIVWAVAWPWNGEVAVLEPLCIGCLIRRVVVAATPASAPRPPRQSRQSRLPGMEA